MSDKVYGLDDTVSAFDVDGNHYRRKIRVGIKRGEFVVERAKDGTPLIYQAANPTHLNLHDLETGKPIRHELKPEKGPDPIRLCWMITEAAYQEATA